MAVPFPPDPPMKHLAGNYLMYGEPTQPNFRIGLPVHTSTSGRRSCFLDCKKPIVTVNLSLPKLHFAGLPGAFVQIGVFNAAMSGATIVVAPPQAQTYLDGHYVIPESSLWFDSASKGLTTAPQHFAFKAFKEYVPPGKRTLIVTWDPQTVSHVITRESLQTSFTRVGHAVETVYKAGTGKARVIFRNPYSVASILLGQEEVPYDVGAGQRVVLGLERKKFEDKTNSSRKILVVWELAEHVNYVDLITFFRRYGGVSDLAVQKIKPGDQPRYGVVTFCNVATVNEVLKEKDYAVYIGDKEVRVYPFELKTAG